ncbi:MAG: dihydrofolate reductase [Icmadophila ericetorum]|nr:dihydrofolate reductase [Icmadophila ericetorum]
MPPPSPLTLIVATTRALGIGHNGALPWPPIKQEMAYFARVTKRSPPSSSSSNEQSKSKKCINAVVMGRKTWESIPERFRPLKGRVNVVVSRHPEALGFSKDGNTTGSDAKEAGEEPPMAVSSLEDALSTLQSRYSPSSSTNSLQLGRVFIIGGAQIYAQSLKLPSCQRVLLTRMKKDYECDTFLPELEVLGRENGGWVLRREEDRDEWIGEKLGEKGGGGQEWKVEMWEKEAVIGG